MAYFGYLPSTFYKGDGADQFIVVKDIITRARILDFIKETPGSLLDYTIRDGERPEQLAHRVYGKSDLHWTILMYNEIHDPYFEWPLSSQELEALVLKKYEGVTYFIDYKGAINDSFNPYPSKNFWFEEGLEVTISGVSKTPIIQTWDANFYKIVVPAGSPTDIIGETITQTRSDGVSVRATIKKVVLDNQYAVHHFEDENTQEIVDHHLIDVTNIGPYNTGNDNSSFIDRYVINNQEVIALEERTIASVTNVEYETRLNDSKRVIQVMRPEYVTLVTKDMRRIFNE